MTIEATYQPCQNVGSTMDRVLVSMRVIQMKRLTAHTSQQEGIVARGQCTAANIGGAGLG